MANNIKLTNNVKIVTDSTYMHCVNVGNAIARLMDTSAKNYLPYTAANRCFVYLNCSIQDGFTGGAYVQIKPRGSSTYQKICQLENVRTLKATLMIPLDAGDTITITSDSDGKPWDVYELYIFGDK